MGLGSHARLAAAGALLQLLSACSSDAGEEPSTICDGSAVPGNQCDKALALKLPEELPPARGNRYADDETAAMLGFRLFFSTELGGGSGVSCPTCHLPELAFTDRVPVSTGTALGTRNSPTTFNVARLSVLFWDGRADSVWSQPLFAIESPEEMASSRLQVAHLIANTPDFRADYEAVFGPMPDVSGWPAAGKPGDAAFDDLSESVKDEVNRIAANTGKAFEAYERRNSTGLAALDLFLAGDSASLIPAAQRGLNVFLAQKCDTCHSGPMLTDERFHDVGFPSLPDAVADAGAAGGVEVLRDNVFNLQGPYADDADDIASDRGDEEPAVGSFRTPSLRNVTRSPPYGHDGAVETLGDVLALHAPETSQAARGDLLAFLQALNGDYPPLPWSNWPQRQ